MRCAVLKGWIYHWNEMFEDLNINSDEQDRPIFCNDHRERGILTFKIRGMDGLKTKTKKSTNSTNSPKIVKPVAVIQMSSP